MGVSKIAEGCNLKLKSSRDLSGCGASASPAVKMRQK